MTLRFKPRSRSSSSATARPKADHDQVFRALQAEIAARRAGYRERSLKLHGWICARCAREFDASSLHLLTVHHKDGNHDHNPPDGSNWENLCADCHEAEHTAGLLGDYLTGRDRDDR